MFNGSDCIKKKNRQAAPTSKQDFSRKREPREKKNGDLTKTARPFRVFFAFFPSRVKTVAATLEPSRRREKSEEAESRDGETTR